MKRIPFDRFSDKRFYYANAPPCKQGFSLTTDFTWRILLCTKTNYKQYHETAHNNVHSFAFLTKPISKKIIYKQLNDILIYESQNNDPLYIARFITYEQGLTEFNIDDIYFFEYIKKRYVKICSKSGDYHFNEKIANIDIDMASYNFWEYPKVCVNLQTDVR